MRCGALGVNDWGSNLCLGVNYASDTGLKRIASEAEIMHGGGGTVL